MKISLTVQSFRNDTMFILNIPIILKQKGGDMVLVLCKLPMKLNICTKFRENVDDRFKVIEWIRF